MYKSEIIRLGRNLSKDIEIPFTASYVRVDIIQLDRGLTSISLDDGDDIPILYNFIALDYKFTKLTFKNVSNGPDEGVEILYFIKE